MVKTVDTMLSWFSKQAGSASDSLLEQVYPLRALWEREYAGKEGFDFKKVDVVPPGEDWNKDTHVNACMQGKFVSEEEPNYLEHYSGSTRVH